MASGDEPQLGGQQTDNGQGDLYPMISSVVTKVIADARGAYLAGNLQALWDRMDEGQRLEFQRGLVRQALYYADQLVPPDSEDQVQRTCLDAASQWVEDGSAESIEALHVAARQLYHPDPSNDYDLPPMPDMVAYHIFHTTVGPPAATLPLWNYPRYVARLAAEHVGHHPYMSEGYKAAGWLAHRWQAEAAWAVLNRRALPPLQMNGSNQAQAAYWNGQLLPLVDLLDEGQRLALKRAIVEHTLWHVERALPPEDQDRGERACVDVVRRWLQAPTSEQAEAAQAVYAHVSQPGTRYDQQLLRAALNTIQVVRSADRDDWVGLSRDAGSTVRQVSSAGNTPQGLEVQELAVWWHVEAAWAILQGTDLPPMEG